MEHVFELIEKWETFTTERQKRVFLSQLKQSEHSTTFYKFCKLVGVDPESRKEMRTAN